MQKKHEYAKYLRLVVNAFLGGLQRGILHMPFSGSFVQWEHCEGLGRTPQSGLCVQISPFK